MSPQESVACSWQVKWRERFVADRLGLTGFARMEKAEDFELGDPVPAFPTFHDEDEGLDHISVCVAEELSNALVQGIGCQKPNGSAPVSCPLGRSANLQKLHLLMVAERNSNILAKLISPFKDELLDAGFRAVVMDSPRNPLRIQVQPGGSEQLVYKDAFCIGRLPACEVHLDINDPATSRIHICIFNMPGCIIVVDGWSWPGTRLEIGGKRIPRRATGSIFMVPHGTTAMLHIGKQRVLINAAKGHKSAMQVSQQE